MNDTQLTIWFAGFYEGLGNISNDIQNKNRIILTIFQNRLRGGVYWLL